MHQYSVDSVSCTYVHSTSIYMYILLVVNKILVQCTMIKVLYDNNMYDN